jgi:transcriptional regulator with AAA-type ATPase domain
MFPTAAERRVVEAISELAYCNPFLPERIDCERRALGDDFLESKAMWNVHPTGERDQPNVDRLRAVAERIVVQLRERMNQPGGRAKASERDLSLYEDLALFVLYHRYHDKLKAAVHHMHHASGGRKVTFYRAFRADAQRLFEPMGQRAPGDNEVAHFFACYFQIRRAFDHIFSYLIGVSGPSVRLRAAIWQSIFTHDMRRYRRTLFDRMGDITTLITGGSGTGKELVARAIGLSRYVPFDAEREAFAEDFAGSFHALNLSALSPTLIESELFGHRRGAFTGAVTDRAGWLEVCPPLGTVFLDEIGELDASIQVKLLRVLQSRTFQRIGDTHERKFQGKIVAATNRDIDAELEAGTFREDFYYRLCADRIHTPTLREQLADTPEELRNLCYFLAKRMVGEDEAVALAREAERYIEERLGREYPWPGNVRELEQCVRNVLIRKTYRPARRKVPSLGDGGLGEAIERGELTADELLKRYVTQVYAKTGSYLETARRLGIDRRTVKEKVDAELLAELKR